MKNTIVIMSIVAILAVALPDQAQAQHPRSAVLVDPTPATDSGGPPVVVSRGDLSAVALVDGASWGGGEVVVMTSDGRGLSWSSAGRVDSDALLAAKHLNEYSVQIVDYHIYVCWDDSRNGNSEVYFNFSHDGGATWGGERLIDKGYAAGSGSVSRYAMAASRDPLGGPDHVYFLFATFSPGTLDAELYFTASHNAGSSFDPAVHLPAGYAAGAYRVYNIALRARNGLDVYAAWQDNRNTGIGTVFDIFSQFSNDGGATWLPADQQVNTVSGFANGDFSMDAKGTDVLVAWTDERSAGGTDNDELRCNFSTTGGASWQPADILLGGYTPGTDDVMEPDCRLVGGGNMVTAWLDDRTGLQESYVAVSTDGGTTWPETALSSGNAIGLQVRGAGNNIGIFWQDFALNTAEFMSLSRDSGVTWGSPLQVSTTTGDCEGTSVTYGGFYGNFVMTYFSDDLGTTDNVYVGGVRPATLEPKGSFAIGNTVYFSVDHMPLAESGWQFGVLMSAGLGNWRLPFGDFRFTGLQNDAYLAWSLGNIPGLMSGTINAAGHGTTPSVTIPFLPPPLPTLRFVAVAFNGGGGVNLGSITDVETRTISP